MIALRRLHVLALTALAAMGLAGCVERKLTIGSDPPGAILLLNDVEVGRTPVTVPFTWYGDYDVRLRYEKNVGTPEKPKIVRYYLHTHRKTTTPWFETIGIDLFADLSPQTYVDHQVWAFAIPQVEEPSEKDLIQRARDMKADLEKPPAPPR
jgi:hypothetical protein